jgi:hypothetical protein
MVTRNNTKKKTKRLRKHQNSKMKQIRTKKNKKSRRKTSGGIKRGGGSASDSIKDVVETAVNLHLNGDDVSAKHELTNLTNPKQRSCSLNFLTKKKCERQKSIEYAKAAYLAQLLNDTSLMDELTKKTSREGVVKKTPEEIIQLGQQFIDEQEVFHTIEKNPDRYAHDNSNIGLDRIILDVYEKGDYNRNVDTPLTLLEYANDKQRTEESYRKPVRETYKRMLDKYRGSMLGLRAKIDRRME